MEVKVFNPLTSEFLKIFSDLRDPVASNHDKIIVVDDEWVVIGTYNMDPLSEQINSEVCVAVKAKSFAKRNRLRIEKDMAESIEYKVNVRSDGKIETVVDRRATSTMPS